MNILVYLKAGTEHLPEVQSFTGNVTSPYERNILAGAGLQTNKQTNKQRLYVFRHRWKNIYIIIALQIKKKHFFISV